MSRDIRQFERFYASAAGVEIRDAIQAKLDDAQIQDCIDPRLCIGYCSPYLGAECSRNAPLCFAAPAAQGVRNIRNSRGQSACLVDECALPFPDRTFERILAIHALEHCADDSQFLRECWRVLSGQGRIALVAPNRSGFWMRAERSPFGHGRPYSSRQLQRLLTANGFEIVTCRTALNAPPFSARFPARARNTVEKIGARLWPALAGVLIIDAIKIVYRGIPATRRRSDVFAPVIIADPAG